MVRLQSIAIVFLFLACRQQMAPEVVVRAHFEAANRHDTAALRELYTPDAAGESPNWGKVVYGPDSIGHQYDRMFASTPDLKCEIRTISSGLDHVVVEYTLSGTLTNLEKEVPEFMRGKKYAFPVCTIFELKDDKIIREASYFDQVAFLRQVGFFEARR